MSERRSVALLTIEPRDDYYQRIVSNGCDACAGKLPALRRLLLADRDVH